uniref:Amino acid permease n=1 Tax=Eiseniibacteriota bacterium TaxID=2212470 RepID=A0A832IAI1_UNCEI
MELRRQIGLYAATAITVGNIVGSGIFRSPHAVAQEIPGMGLAIAAWVVGGLLSLCGSLVLAELAATHPRTGGLYVFIREGFGDAWGFAFGWANLWVIKPTVIAAITSVFALYFCEALHLPKSAELAAGCGAIVLLTVINTLGVREGAGTTAVFTTLKVAGILALCVAAFTLAAVHPPGAPEPHADPAAAARPLWIAFSAAMIPVLFAYDGWTDSTYVGGEIVRPERNLPIAIVWGTALVIVLYVLTNLAYFRVLGAGGVATYPAVGSETMGRLLGEGGRTALAVLVAVSTFGTVNGSVLTGPRVTQAMAADGLLWKPLAAIHPRRGTPVFALWVQAALACLWLAVANGFEDISGWFVTTSWLFYGLTTAAVFALRRRERAAGAPAHGVRTPLYPFTAWLFILVTIGLIASDLGASGWRAAAGVLIAATAFPVYWVWKGRRAAA